MDNAQNKHRSVILRNNRKSEDIFVVIDDDPTGCQTVHNIDILLTTDQAVLEEQLKTKKHFFILTNSRSLSSKDAFEVNKQICQKLKRINKHVRIISRSDSTLRGHFKEEIDGITSVFNDFDGILIVPCFFEGARHTINDHHYIRQNDRLISVDQTEFAKDADFSFSTSHLPSWIQEKTKGSVSAESVVSIGIDDLFKGDTRLIRNKLLEAPKGSYMVVNSESYSELEKIMAVVSELESKGKKYLYRAAASLVKTRLGIVDTDFYIPKIKRQNGLIIVGSYVKKTTEQLNYLLGQETMLTSIEISIQKIFDCFSDYINEVATSMNLGLANGTSVVVYTERQYRRNLSTQDGSKINSMVSLFLSKIVNQLELKPGFIISKGGITSHDIAASGLKVTKAKVLGQLIAGVPIWKLKDGTFPSMEYIVFPGNVGSEDSLYDAYNKLTRIW